jgi:hypothetical protein
MHTMLLRATKVAMDLTRSMPSNGNGLGEAGDLAPDAEERGVGEAEEFGGEGRVELDERPHS